jgi:hypothetical protein
MFPPQLPGVPTVGRTKNTIENHPFQCWWVVQLKKGMEILCDALGAHNKYPLAI